MKKILAIALCLGMVLGSASGIYAEEEMTIPYEGNTGEVSFEENTQDVSFGEVIGDESVDETAGGVSFEAAVDDMPVEETAADNNSGFSDGQSSVVEEIPGEGDAADHSAESEGAGSEQETEDETTEEEEIEIKDVNEDEETEKDEEDEAEEAEEEEELLTDTTKDWDYTVLSNGSVQLNRYLGTAKTVSIPSKIAGKKVTVIGDGNYDCIFPSVWEDGEWKNKASDITKITIPNTVQTINYRAFAGCVNLTSVNIPNSVTEIGNYAFSGCTSLKSIVIPNSITSLDHNQFADCSALSNISLPNTLKRMESTFRNCTSLKSIVIPNSVEYYYGAFSGCTSLTSATLPNAASSVSGYAFSGCTSLTSVTLPNTVTRISYDAFSGCTSLRAITLPQSVNLVDDSAFQNCTNLRKINLDNVNSVGSKAFESCIHLSEANMSQKRDDDARWRSNSIGSEAFRNCISLKTVKLPRYTTSIGENAFYDCSSLSSLTMHVKVETVNQAAFRNCSALKNVYYGGTANDWKKITIGLYNEPLKRATKQYMGATKINIPAKITAVPGGTAALKPQLSPSNTWDAIEDIEWSVDGHDAYSMDKMGNYKLSYYDNQKMITVTAKIRDVSAKCVITVRERPRLWCSYHQQRIGNNSYGGSDSISLGVTGEGLRMEAFSAKICSDDYGKNQYPDLNIEYRSHVQSYGWQDWRSNGALSGTKGEGKRLEAIQMRLSGKYASSFDIYYRVHAQHFGWMGWAKNGEQAGTSGFGYRVEAIIIQLVPKGGTPSNYSYLTPSIDSNYVDRTNGPTIGKNDALLAYNTHVQTYGWQEYKYDGAMAGTSGQAKRLEGIHIQLQNQKYKGSIVYRTHVQTYGWQGWKKDGQMSGTSGEAKRLEGIQIYLTGEMAKHYDVYYRVHAQTYGWLDWAKNGVMAGTSGLAKRLEGIKIVLVPKGGKAPGSTKRPYVVGAGGKLPSNPYKGT